MEEIIIGEFKMTGGNTIDTDLVVKKWNHLWVIMEWKRDNSFRLIKYVRKDSQMTSCKLSLFEKQANELIEKLNLISTNTCFTSGFSWRRRVDMEYLEEWRSKKLAQA